MMFEHFVITEFSVLHGTTGCLPSEDWLVHRWPIFVKFCAASMQRQSCKDFSWVIAISPDNPSWVKSRLMELRISQIRIMEIEESPSAQDYANFILKNSSSPMILTSRLDSDDAVSPKFVKRLHELATKNPNAAYNYPRGIQLSDVGLLKVNWPNGPFVSLMEDRNSQEFGTVLKYQHDYVSKSINVLQDPTFIAWMQVVHDRNIGNRAAGIPTFKRLQSDAFPMIPKHTRFHPKLYLRSVKPIRKLSKKLFPWLRV